MNSPSKVVLAYSIAITVLSLSGIIAFIYIDNFLQGKPDYITPYFNPWISYSPTASPDFVFAYQFTAIMSFVSMWIATIFLTSRYASKSKKIKYWTIVSIPLVYFASLYLIPLLQQQDLLGQLGIEDIPIYAYSYNFLLNIVKAAGGIMFGIAFFLLSRTIMHVQLKRSIIMAGAGLILLFGARYFVTRNNGYLSAMGCYLNDFFDNRLVFFIGWLGLFSVLPGNRFFIAKNNCYIVTKGA